MTKDILVFISIAVTIWIFWTLLEWLLCGDVQFKKSDDVISWILIGSLYLNYEFIFKED